MSNFIGFPDVGGSGSPDTPAQIKAKLETLTGNARLSASSIKDLKSGSIVLTINQAAHGFVAADALSPLAVNSTGWGFANGSDADTTTSAILESVIDVNNFTICFNGIIDSVGHGLTVDEFYWLGDTDGAVTPTQPTSGIAQQIFHVLNANQILVSIGQPHQASSTSNLGTRVVEFGFKDERLYGERGDAISQGWTHPSAGTSDLVTDTDGLTSRQVLRLNDDGANIYTVRKDLTADDWLKIYTYGASFSGRVKLDTANGGGGCYIGLQVDAAQSPDSSTDDRRYGFLLTNPAGINELHIEQADSGLPQTLLAGTQYDEYNDFEISIPAAFGQATLTVNGAVIADNIDITVNGGGTGTGLVWSSGSSSGTDRITYMTEFGATIFEESPAKTISQIDFAGYSSMLIVTPKGRRAYALTFAADITGNDVGRTIDTFAQNSGSGIAFSNAGSPAALTLNGLATGVFPIGVPRILRGVNTTNNGNDYVVDFASPDSLIPTGVVYPSPDQYSGSFGTVYRVKWTGDISSTTPVTTRLASAVVGGYIKFRDTALNLSHFSHGGYSDNAPHYLITESTEQITINKPANTEFQYGHVDFIKG